MKRFFRKAPPPGWEPPEAQVVKPPTPRADYEKARLLGRAVPVRSTGSMPWSATRPTDTIPWTAAAISRDGVTLHDAKGNTQHLDPEDVLDR